MTEQINRFLERIYKLHTSKEVKMALNRVGGGDYTNINSLI
jgi:hypothetical protein